MSREDGTYLLFAAAFSGTREDAERALAKGAPINAHNEWNETPLHVAAGCGNKSVAQFLIDRGADLNARDDWHRTPRDAARANGFSHLEALLHAAMTSRPRTSKISGNDNRPPSRTRT
jgi:ankyrin repeat protein